MKAGAESWRTLQHTKTVESLPYKQPRAVERFLSGWLSCNYVRFSSLVCKINKINNIFLSLPAPNFVIYQLGHVFFITRREGEERKTMNGKLRVLLAYVSHYAVLLLTKENLE